MIGAGTELIGVVRVYQGSDGAATLALYKRLEEMGTVGVVAVNLFRACKASERAKDYRGQQTIVTAYGKKQWSMGFLAEALGRLTGADVLPWGWGEDPEQSRHNVVLYVDLPTGQVSFHTDHRGDGPIYAGAWDGKNGQGADRICRWVARLLAQHGGAS